MNINILKFLKSYSNDIDEINRLLVSTFLSINKISNIKNKLILDLIISNSGTEEYVKLNQFIAFFNEKFDLEDLLTLFEFVVSPLDKEVNGAIYTPKYIRDYIITNVFTQYEKENNSFKNLKIADISCGCGGFFKEISNYLVEKTNKSYREIYKNNIYGIDIEEYSINRTKILLVLNAIQNGEDHINFEFNFIVGNSLEFNWSELKEIKKNQGFDIIVGNPPYVSSSKMDTSTKELLENWSVTKSGKADLYIPFFQIALNSLKKNGILGYITVNTFQKSLNARSLRKYFSENKFEIKIIDFEGEQVFKSRSTYTCLCFITKKNEGAVNYIKSSSYKLNSIKEANFIKNNYVDLDDYEGWYLVDNYKKAIITKIENKGTKLGDKFSIKNGFATLKNKVYIFKPIKEDNKYYYLDYKSKIFKIEKNICKNAIKPNTLKRESEIDDNLDKVIFPYNILNQSKDIFDNSIPRLKILEEDFLKNNYPNTYKYLMFHKETLSERDKGNREYEKWYAFGRNQALTLNGYKLLLPYITDKPCFVYTNDKELLFYNGYAIFSNNERELLILQKILMSKIFWFYIENTSRPYSGNYYSVAKNYIKKFGLPKLTNEEENFLLSSNNEEINSFLLKKYEIEL
ncbi:Eco57I restriction-modification methylase domain-containing protein [Myroides odoratimimus]|uniref:Eco57I restriction-modification methylase domain-containing protein n=1 Tax=Myroides odoratimimus TaxID=76832 RepID=UPI002DBA165A|nr:Eco57I restriction-modification methylase domain-containing protein [Myroides odoratimimus]MEC4036568.1 Eco57I restriction-modification methylase domain-containing protein [Myroides odoratimimus]